MDYKEFKEKYMGKSSRWDFKKFRIVCNSCNNDKVEFNGFLESESGYYGEHELIGQIVVKCHSCGQAFSINLDNNFGENEIELNIDGEKKYLESLKNN